MAAKRRRTTKIHWNIGMIIFVVILVYILINVILFLGKKKLTVYKVTEDKITNTLSFTGIAIRDEELLKASQSGYITYYVEEGKRIKKSGTVFTVDKDQKVQDAFVSQVQQLEKNKKVIDDDEIQSLLEEGKGPQLKREVINKKKDSKKKASKKNNSKTGLYIGLGIVGVLLISLLIFGGIKLVTSGLSGSDEKTEEVQKKNYQELLDFANNYDSLSSSEKKGIVDLESKYNSLTRKQREKIDEILEKATGKNFNELLAKANKKTNSKKKNNNTEIAEKKAELRKNEKL